MGYVYPMFLFCYVGTHVLSYMFTISAILDCQFVWQICFWQIKGSVVFWYVLRFFIIQKNGTRNFMKLMIVPWFQCHSHTSVFRHPLELMNRHWASSTSPERCQLDVVFAQNLAIIKKILAAAIFMSKCM